MLVTEGEGSGWGGGREKVGQQGCRNVVTGSLRSSCVAGQSWAKLSSNPVLCGCTSVVGYSATQV